MGDSNRSKAFKGFGSQTIITVTLGVLGLLYFSIMSRLLTQEDFGYFAIITAVTAILTSLSEAGLGAAVIQYKDAGKNYIQTAWTLSLFLGVFFCLFLFVSAGLMSRIMVGSDVLKQGYRIMSFSLIFYAINGVGRSVIIKRLDFLQYGIYSIIAYTLSSIIGIIMAYNGMGFYAVVYAMLLNQVFLGIELAIANRRVLAIKIHRQFIKQIVNFGGWLTGSVIIRNITNEADKLITTHWIPVAQLGAYNRPTGLITQITGNVYGIFDTILFPILSGINDDSNKLTSAYHKSVNLIVLFSFFLTACFVLGSDLIIQIFLGDKWLYLSNVFQIVSLTILFLSYDQIADCFFRSLGIVKPYFMVRCFVLVFTCISMFIGCQFGIIGLAIGLVISKIASNIVKIVFLSRRINLDRPSFYKELSSSILLPLLLFALCYIVKITVSYGSVISLFVYIASIGFIAIFKPDLFGTVFKENVYSVFMKRIHDFRAMKR